MVIPLPGNPCVCHGDIIYDVCILAWEYMTDFAMIIHFGVGAWPLPGLIFSKWYTAFVYLFCSGDQNAVTKKNSKLYFKQ